MFPVRDHNHSGRFPLVTLFLIFLNTLLFLYSWLVPEFVLKYTLIPSQVNFANLKSLFPFLSSMYLHGGWFHLMSNMWFLWIFGDNVEAKLGKISFFLFFTICGVMASFFQYLTSPDSTIPMVGASGAIAGVLGAYLIFFPKARIDTYVVTFGGFLHQIQVPASFMLVYWFILQLFSGLASFDVVNDGIAWWAHIGGFMAGVFLAKLNLGKKHA